MKDHFFIGVLLLICAQCAHTASILFKRDVSDAEALKQLNDARKAIADKLQIANMHELAYDNGYKQKLQQGKCEELEKGDFLFVPLPTPAQMEPLQHLDVEQKPDMANVLAAGVVGTFLNPKFSRIACEELAQPCHDLKAGCLFGPGSSVSESDFIKGEPGSACPNGKASSGLCAASYRSRRSRIVSDRRSGGSTPGYNDDVSSSESPDTNGGSWNGTVESSGAGEYSTTLTIVVLAFANLI